MASVSEVQAIVNPKTTSTSASGVQATEDRFLKLLVTQMKNQDPLNPLDNAEVTSQMAQLSTVTGIEKLNTSMETMAQSFAANQSLQAANMIGHGVLAPGSALQLFEGASLAGFDLESAADKVTVTIKDADGAVVRTLDLGKKGAGATTFSWDGKTQGGELLEDGDYSFSVEAMQGTEKVKADRMSLHLVTSVSLGATGTTLNLSDGTKLDAAKVTQIF